MKELFKYGLLGLGGYLLWRQFSPQTAAEAATAQSAPAPQPAASQQPAGPPLQSPVVPPVLPIPQVIGATARKLNADQWNYYVEQRTGQAQPAPEDFLPLGFDRWGLMTEQEYKAFRAAAGLAGLPHFLRRFRAGIQHFGRRN